MPVDPGSVVSAAKKAMSWLHIAQDVKRMVSEFKGRSKHLTDFISFLETVAYLLEQVDKETSGLPECVDMLQTEQQRVARAIAECERWAAKHKVWHTYLELNEAAAIRAKIQDSIVLLQLGLTIWSRKQNETSARERATELATELTKQIRSSAETVAERIEATNLRREEQVAAERKAETEARLAQDLQRKRSEASADALLELCIEQLKQRTAAQTHVRADTQTSTEEHKTTPAKIGTVDAILMRLSAPFMRVTEEGAKVREVSAEDVLSDFYNELAALESTLSTIVAPSALDKPKQLADVCRSALETARQALGGTGTSGTEALEEHFSALRDAVEAVPRIAFSAPLSAPGTYVPPTELDTVVQHLRSRPADESAPRPVWLHGAPGLGKSALCRALHDRYHTTHEPDQELRHAYPDGVVLVSWRPSGATAVSSAAEQCEDKDSEAARWLHELRQPDVGLAGLLACTEAADPDKTPPEVLRHLCQQLRQTLRQRTLLVILDDVWPEDVPLLGEDWLAVATLNGSSTCVVAPCGARLAPSDGNYHAIELRPIDPPRAQKILLRMASTQIYLAGTPVDVPSEVESIVENLVEQCDGHALALVLVASAVKRSAELRKRDEPGAAEWRSVLHDMARLRDTSDDEAPMRAYTIAVGRQSELGKSIMSTLCLFPGGCRAPVDMVREIWLANQRGIWHVCRRAVRAIWRAVWPVSLWPSPVGDAAAEFDAALDALAKARIVNLLKSTSGAAHDDLSFHHLLGDYLASKPRPLAPHVLPCTSTEDSSHVVHSLVSLCAAGQQAGALSSLKAQLASPDAPRALAAASEALLALGRSCAALAAMRHAYAILSSTLGTHHLRSAEALSSVGTCLGALGHYNSALRHQERALAITLHVDGASHLTSAARPVRDDRAQGTLEHCGEALQQLQKARAIRQCVQNTRHRSDLSWVNYAGSTLWALRQHGKALQGLQQALTTARSAYGTMSPDTVAALDGIERAVRALGCYRVALVQEEEARAIRRAAHGAKHLDTAASLRAVADTLVDLARYDDALEHRQQALAMIISEKGDQHHDTMDALLEVGNTLYMAKRHKEALQYGQRALAVAEHAFGKGDEHNIAMIQVFVGSSLWHLGRYNEALELHELAIVISRGIFGDRHWVIADHIERVGLSLRSLGRYNEALECHEEALDILKAAVGNEHFRTAASLHATADTLWALGRYDAALEREQGAIDVARRLHGDEHAALPSFLSTKGLILQALGRRDDALENFREAVNVCTSVHEPQDGHRAAALNHGGGALRARGRHHEALQQQQEALALRRSTLGEQHPETAQSLNDVGCTLRELGRLDEALLHGQEALELRISTLGDQHPETATSYNDLGDTLRALGRLGEALQHHQRALAIRKSKLGDEHPDTVAAMKSVDTLRQGFGRRE